MSIDVRVPAFMDHLHCHKARHVCLDLPDDVAIEAHPLATHMPHHICAISGDPQALPQEVHSLARARPSLTAIASAVSESDTPSITTAKAPKKAPYSSLATAARAIVVKSNLKEKKKVYFASSNFHKKV